MQTNDTITKQSVLQRPGWSAAILKKLLGDPDERKERGSRYAPLCLYAVERVVAAEASPDFAAAQAKREAASARSRAVAERKRNELLDRIDAMPIIVRVVKNPTARAIESYNQRQIDRQIYRDRYESYTASKNSDPAFLRRITVNYIRHELTEYDAHLDSTFGQIGTDAANERIRNRVLAAIAEAYPALREEALNQMWRRAQD